MQFVLQMVFHFQYLIYLKWLKYSKRENGVRLNLLFVHLFRGRRFYLCVTVYAVGGPTAWFYLIRIESPKL